MMGPNTFLAWLAWVNPPRVPATGTKTNVRALAVTAASLATEIDNDLLMANTVPSQPASNQGELPGVGRVRIQMEAGAQDVWVLFAQTQAAAVVDNTDATALQIGWRIPANTSQIFVINPTVDKWFACRAPAGQTSVLRYMLISPPSNNRP